MKKYSLGKIGKNIKKLRKERDLSREELAKRAKVNYNTIIKLESGTNQNPTIKTLLGIASVFEVDVEALLC